jgi:hypothetical protein
LIRSCSARRGDYALEFHADLKTLQILEGSTLTENERTNG